MGREQVKLCVVYIRKAMYTYIEAGGVLLFTLLIAILHMSCTVFATYNMSA